MKHPAPPYTPSSDDMALLPPFPALNLAHITLVRTAAQACDAWESLRQHPVWGFDTESKPTFFKDQVSDGPHVLQLATTDHAWVIQLHDADCRAEVARWLANPAHQKAGFAQGDDTKRHRRKLFVDPDGVVEMNTLFRQRGYRREMGVKAAVAVLFGQRFAKSKKAATSNWAALNLSEQQVRYAANDAYAAAWVYAALQRGQAPVPPPAAAPTPAPQP
ncbi:MAG: 3'-5' exonuclease [Burkholderiaceae bacterium]|nr:3'-5' exonuclease [Burkholderiaceae bacterium]